MSGSYDDFGRQVQPTVNMSKKLDLDEAGSNYRVLTGAICCYVMWASEKGFSLGPLGKKINLDAFGAASNDAHEFVAVAHPDFEIADDGNIQYGEDVKAGAGKHAQEGVVFDLEGLTGREDVSDLVFGATCVGNPLGMSKLGELRVKITQVEFERVTPGDDTSAYKLDKKGKRIVKSETVLVPPTLRSIEDPATAALFFRLHLTPQGAQLRRITDLTVSNRRLDGQQAWRDLLGGLRNAVQRSM